VIKETAKDTVKETAKETAKQDVKATKNNETSYSSTQSIKIANNKGIIPKTTIFKVSNNVSNENIEFYNIRDYGRWCETDIAKNGSWKIIVS
jgi:hypothetical protein